jgi:hypothetical protein
MKKIISKISTVIKNHFYHESYTEYDKRPSFYDENHNLSNWTYGEEYVIFGHSFYFAGEKAVKRLWFINNFFKQIFYPVSFWC